MSDRVRGRVPHPFDEAPWSEGGVPTEKQMVYEVYICPECGLQGSPATLCLHGGAGPATERKRVPVVPKAKADKLAKELEEATRCSSGRSPMTVTDA